MKFLILVGDGMADYPLEELGGKTPLESAQTPHLDDLVSSGIIGRVYTIPEGFPAGSDVANLNILSYDPAVFFTGRAPLEAASMGIPLSPRDVAFRCNLVTVENGMMVDYSAGHISSEEASVLINSVDVKMGRKNLKFYPGVSYRNLTVFQWGPGENRHTDVRKVQCTPPHDIAGNKISAYLPRGKGSRSVRRLMRESVTLLDDHPVNRRRAEKNLAVANMIWLWGQGQKPQLPSFQDKFGLSGAVISAVDLVKGLGRCAGLEVIDVPGATGYFDTDYRAKVDYALTALERLDFLFVHVEAPDEAGHEGNIEEKIRAIENFDALVVGPALEKMPAFGGNRILVLSDHLTPISVRTHVPGNNPFAICGSGISPGGQRRFSESAAEESHVSFDKGCELLPWFLDPGAGGDAGR